MMIPYHRSENRYLHETRITSFFISFEDCLFFSTDYFCTSHYNIDSFQKANYYHYIFNTFFYFNFFYSFYFFLILLKLILEQARA
jgi:hypothetical protein